MGRPASEIDLILASASPRRRDLLSWLGLRLDIRPSDIDERQRSGEPCDDYVLRVSAEKATAVPPGDSGWVLGADTIVVVDGESIGKPRDRSGARNMLRRLAGRQHTVITGYCLMNPEGGIERSRAVETSVEIRPVANDELEAYLDLGEWTDKAGSYAVQGAGAMFIRALHGSWTNVVGLPLAEVAEDLCGVGVCSVLPRVDGGPS